MTMFTSNLTEALPPTPGSASGSAARFTFTDPAWLSSLGVSARQRTLAKFDTL